ncbi:hypothetical protein ACVH9Z_19245 [Rhodococcus opacus]|uniref:Integral membrane protein n=2 Tax=Rhodococcus opacus TaxID=37919 RepID=A0AAX3YLE7_RHOOP|nr:MULTISPECIES: hypothetical protein [Rhodococcus]NHU42429.1 hypothetical protein [Rhodococcus sp. A14]EKT81807.1 hypothetical protein WSS_A14984 [Rhodococcus opacus M213]MBA8960183.1 hypothetical protein [Rhodococcus opacus]MBP2205748.1 hypothetical protein [Rhodococcus opacus]MCZ4589445.1 hypothetical protein [Rhodococcus opacus]
MDWDLPRLLNRPPLISDEPLSPDHAASRISAYIYGNILVLAALIPVTKSQETLGIAIVVGAALSTFLAHVFAESVGQTLRLGRSLSSTERLRELRDSVPVLTSAVVPAVILGTALLGWLEPRTAQLTAEIVMIARIGSISYVISRLRRERVTNGTHLAAFGLAVIATIIVVIKVFLTH